MRADAMEEGGKRERRGDQGEGGWEERRGIMVEEGTRERGGEERWGKMREVEGFEKRGIVVEEEVRRRGGGGRGLGRETGENEGGWWEEGPLTQSVPVVLSGYVRIDLSTPLSFISLLSIHLK